MGSRYYWSVAILAALASHAAAQGKSIIPQDLQAGFTAGGDEIQVSFTGKAVDGFEDGTVFEKDAVAKEPTFALGDSNGISPTTLYTIIMVDTTCQNARRLHYARANFKNNFDITNIATDSAPIVDYVAPGSVGEKGDNRQYSFLMYLNPDRKEIADLKLPGENEAFDVKKFQDDNGLRDALAGVGMEVKLGGEANCEGGEANEPPSNSPTATSASSATRSASRTSAAASTTRTADAEVPQSTVRPSPTASGSGGQRNSTSVSPPRPSRTPANPAVSSPVAVPSETPQSSDSPDSPESPETPGPSEAPVPSGISTVPVPNSSGASTATSTANPAEQTANAAPGGFRNYNCEIVALVMALGVLVA